MSDEETKVPTDADAGPGQEENNNNGDRFIDAQWQVIWSPDDVLSVVFSLTPNERKNTTIVSVTATVAAATHEGVVVHSFAGCDVRATTTMGEGQELAGNLGLDARHVRKFSYGEKFVLQAILAGEIEVRDQLPRNYFFTKVIPMPIHVAQPVEADADDDTDDSEA